MLNAIFFDNDGVLVDTEKYSFQATQEIFAKYGISVTLESFRENVLRKSRGLWYLANELGFTATEQEQIRFQRNQRYAELVMNQNVCSGYFCCFTTICSQTLLP